MNVERFCIKFLARPGQVDEAAFIPIFHEWIRLKKLPGVLIDVADYRHVPEGPGIMLISHEINYAMEHGGGQFGLSAQRKLGDGATHQERIVDLVKRMALFGSLLQSDPRTEGQLHLEGGRFLYLSNDRLRAPNTEDVFNSIKPELEEAAHQLYGDREVSVSRVDNDPSDRLSVLVETPGTLDIAVLA